LLYQLSYAPHPAQIVYHWPFDRSLDDSRWNGMNSKRIIRMPATPPKKV
jgi:hypothetical protein